MPATPAPHDALLGQIISGQYRIDNVLGQGGMGTVYRGTQLSVGRAVAIKLINTEALGNEQVTKRFSREALALSRLTHPNTVRLFDYGITDQQQPFMVMELLQGRDLSAEVELHGALPVRRALDITLQVLRALQEAHAQGVTHRDLKPSNIFLTQIEGSEAFAKVLDFGIAGFDQTAESAKLTVTGIVMGSAAYMSPEQAQGHAVGPSSDLYSVGAVLFEMLTGSPPFKADTMVSMLVAHITQPPPRLEIARPELNAPAAVQDLIDDLMAKTAEARPPSAKAVADRVQALLQNSGLDQPQPKVVAPVVVAPREVAKRVEAAVAAVTNRPAENSSDAHHPARTAPTTERNNAERYPDTGPRATTNNSHLPLYLGLGFASLFLLGGGAWAVFHQSAAPASPVASAAGLVPNLPAAPQPNPVAPAAVSVEAEVPVADSVTSTRVPTVTRAPAPQPVQPVQQAPAVRNTTPSHAPAAVPAPTPPAAVPVVQRTPPVASATPAPPPPRAVDPDLTSTDRGTRRRALLRAGLRYPSVQSAKAALAAGGLTRDGYEDTIWVLKTQRESAIRSAKADYKAHKIDKETYRARVEEIDARYRGL